MKKLKVVELFSGIGAQHKALSVIKKQFGNDFEIVGTSEWAMKSIEAYYRIHYSGKNIYKNKTKDELLKDIEKRNLTFSNDGQNPISDRSLYSKSQEFLSKLMSANDGIKNMGSILDIKSKDMEKVAPDLITYSFPCQDLSTGAQFTKSKTGLAGSRSGLLYEVERILKGMSKSKLPKFLLLENVQQLVKNKEFYKGYQRWEKQLEKLGYKTNAYLFNAKDFGIPQTRKRVFALSFLGSTEFKTEAEIIDLYNEKYSKRSKTLKQIIRRDKYPIEQIRSMTKPTPSREMMRARVPKLLETRFTFTNTLTKKQDRTPCPGTINMTGYDDILNIVEKYRPDFKGYNYYYRFLTPRETFLLMGFDSKDFDRVKKMELGVRPYYEMAGNSIVVNNLLPIFDEVHRLWNK